MSKPTPVKATLEEDQLSALGVTGAYLHLLQVEEAEGDHTAASKALRVSLRDLWPSKVTTTTISTISTIITITTFTTITIITTTTNSSTSVTTIALPYHPHHCHHQVRIRLIRAECDTWEQVPGAWQRFVDWSTANAHPKWAAQIAKSLARTQAQSRQATDPQPKPKPKAKLTPKPKAAPPSVVPQADGTLSTQLIQSYLDENELVLEAINANINDHNVGDALA
jgi:hypothetical protein